MTCELVIKKAYASLLKFKSIFWGGVPIFKVIYKSFWSKSSWYVLFSLVDFLKENNRCDWNEFLINNK